MQYVLYIPFGSRSVSANAGFDSVCKHDHDHDPCTRSGDLVELDPSESMLIDSAYQKEALIPR